MSNPTRTLIAVGNILLFCAFILSLLVSLNKPSVDIARVYYTAYGSPWVTISLGIWRFCNITYNITYPYRSDWECYSGFPYILSLNDNNQTVPINPSWAPGLAIQPIATVLILFSWILSALTLFSDTNLKGSRFKCTLPPIKAMPRLKSAIMSSLLSSIAALIILITFLMECAFVVYVQRQARTFGVRDVTPGRGFWSNYVVLVFLIIAGFSSCFGAPRVIPWQIAGENPNSVKTAARV